MSVSEAAATSSASGAQLKRSVRRGARVALWAQVLSQLISLLVLATLYRLLSLDDYGLFGVVVPVVMLVRNLATLGLGAAAVQREEMTPEVSNALFWWNVRIGGSSMALTALAAPVVAWGYGSVEAGWFTAALAGTAFVASLATQHQALLERGLAWNALAVSRLGGQAVAGFVAVQLALRGHGIWSLAAQQYVELLVTGALFWWYEPWRPSRPSRHPDSRQLLGFGGHFAGAGLMFFIAGNVDKLLLGAMLKAPSQAAAYYTQAFSFMMRPVAILTSPLNSIMLPALARARGDQQTFREVYLSFQRLIAAMLFPVSVGLTLTGWLVMNLLGGPDWRGAGVVLSALAITVFVQGFVNTASSAFAAVGRADKLFFASVLIAASMSATAFLVISSLRHDPELAVRLACWYSAASIAVFIPYQVFCLRTLGIPVMDWFRTIRRALVAALLMGMLVAGVQQFAALALPRSLLRYVQTEPAAQFAFLALQVAIGVVSYVAFAWPECRWLWGQLRGDARIGDRNSPK